MLSRARNHLSYANVVSTLCLFVVLGGSAYAAATITGKNVKDGSLTGKDIENNSVTAQDVKSLGPKDFASGALPRGPEGPRGPVGPQGVPGNDGAPGTTPTPEAFHLVGTSDEPVFQNGWANTNTDRETVGFYKDPGGVVHLRGTATGSNNMVIFQLPPGYRPANGKQIQIAAACGCSAQDSNTPADEVNLPTGRVQIFGDVGTASLNGGVTITPNASFVDFDGVSFRAEG
jgi:hypothetical protein